MWHGREASGRTNHKSHAVSTSQVSAAVAEVQNIIASATFSNFGGYGMTGDKYCLIWTVYIRDHGPQSTTPEGEKVTNVGIW